MTENQTAETAPVVVPETFDPVGKYGQIVARLTSIAGVLSSLKPKAKMIHEMRDETETTDETILAYRAKLAKIDATREKLVEEATNYVKGLVVAEKSDEEIAALRDEAKTLTGEGKALVNVLRMFGTNVDALPALPGVSASGNSGTTGIKRPRVSAITLAGEPVITKTKAADGTVKETATVSGLSSALKAAQKEGKAAKDVDVETATLQALIFEQFGTDDLSVVEDQSRTFNVAGMDVTVYV